MFLFRVGTARRALLLAQWPAVLFAGAACLAAARGALWLAVALAVAAVAAWALWPSLNTRRRNQRQALRPSQADAEACAILGVALDAGEEEIRRAYRAKMSTAHPDRGGAHADAARLTAARDRLLKRKRAER
jgi:Flp pilus assembly protein TadB